MGTECSLIRMSRHMWAYPHVDMGVRGQVSTPSLGDRTLDSLTWLDCHPVLDIQLSSAPNTGIKSAFYFIDFLMWVLETQHRCLCLHGYLSNPGSNFLLRGIYIYVVGYRVTFSVFKTSAKYVISFYQHSILTKIVSHYGVKVTCLQTHALTTWSPAAVTI